MNFQPKFDLIHQHDLLYSCQRSSDISMPFLQNDLSLASKYPSVSAITSSLEPNVFPSLSNTVDGEVIQSVIGVIFSFCTILFFLNNIRPLFDKKISERSNIWLKKVEDSFTHFIGVRQKLTFFLFYIFLYVLTMSTCTITTPFGAL